METFKYKIQSDILKNKYTAECEKTKCFEHKDCTYIIISLVIFIDGHVIECGATKHCTEPMTDEMRNEIVRNYIIPYIQKFEGYDNLSISKA